MFRYKIDLLQTLKDAGYSTYRIRRENIMGQSTLTSLTKGEIISLFALDNVCRVLNCDIGDIIEHIK